MIFFTARDRFYYLSFEEALVFWNRGMTGGRKSFRIEELDGRFFFDAKGPMRIPYLDMINLDLSLRDERNDS